MLLTLSIFTPIILGLILCFLVNIKNDKFIKLFALSSSLISLCLSIAILYMFNKSSSDMQFTEIFNLLNVINIKYNLGIDGISIWLVFLTSLITVLIILAAWSNIRQQLNLYYGCFLILCGLSIGAFTALDGILFYIFFEATLIPMYLVIGIWGGANRVYASIKFFLYTLLGSLLALIAIIYLYTQSSTFEIIQWHGLKLSMQEQIWIFLAFFIAFAVKIPMWPVHTWLPDAHVEAPTGGSMLLAAIMLKLGGYGLIRFCLPISPDASHLLAPYVIALSIIAIVYIGLVAIIQEDMKKLVAYSSIAHMGFVTLGFFIFNDYGMSGGLVQMISHGFISAAMFFCIGVMYDRVHTRNIKDYGGIANAMPKFSAFLLFFAMANCGLPATSGFVGEFLVLMGSIKFNLWIGVLAALTLIFSAAYSLWMYKRVVFGKINNPHILHISDINKIEFFILLILFIATLFMGLFPKYFTDFMIPSINKLLIHIAIPKI